MLDENQLSLIKEKLYKYCGIFLNDSKPAMIKNRIYHLMRDTQIYNIDTLLSNIESNAKIQQQFINSLTTNKTDFFREVFHFQDMIDRSLPALFRLNKPIKILLLRKLYGARALLYCYECALCKKNSTNLASL